MSTHEEKDVPGFECVNERATPELPPKHTDGTTDVSSSPIGLHASDSDGCADGESLGDSLLINNGTVSVSGGVDNAAMDVVTKEERSHPESFDRVDKSIAPTADNATGKPEDYQSVCCDLPESHQALRPSNVTVIMVGKSAAEFEAVERQDRLQAKTLLDSTTSGEVAVSVQSETTCDHSAPFETSAAINENPSLASNVDSVELPALNSAMLTSAVVHQNIELTPPQEKANANSNEPVPETCAQASVPSAAAVIETTNIMPASTLETVTVDITPSLHPVSPAENSGPIPLPPPPPFPSVPPDEKPPIGPDDSCILEMKVIQKAESPQGGHHPAERCDSFLSTQSEKCDICRICHCEGEENNRLISPCLCSGSLKYIHLACLQKWIKSSEKKSCELCNFEYTMTTKTKPFREWERLEMTSAERRKVVCSVTFHLIAITCVIWSLYVLIDRTTEEVSSGTLDWPFWTKLIVVAIGFTGGVVFMYVQCKMYVQLCLRWRAYNKLITVENAPEDPELRAEAAARIKAKADELHQQQQQQLQLQQQMQQQQQQQVQHGAVAGPGAGLGVDNVAGDLGGAGGGGGQVNPVLVQEEDDFF